MSGNTLFWIIVIGGLLYWMMKKGYFGRRPGGEEGGHPGQGLIKCRECGKEVSPLAKNCPNCGAPVKKPGIGCGTILMLFVIIFSLYVINISTRAPSVKKTPGGERIAAYVAATILVEGRLKTPRTAKFPLITNASVEYLGDKRYKISSYVDAQNIYGALVRTYFTCVVKHAGGEGDKWTLENIDME